jgi:glycine cleavage system H protein
MRWIAKMRNAGSGLLLLGLSVLALVLLLPLWAAIGLSMQFLFLAVVPVGMAAALLSPGFRRWLRVESTLNVRGVRLASGVSVHNNHSWLRVRGTRTASVGIDDFAQRVLGTISSVELPTPGTTLEAGQTLAVVHHGDRSIRVPAPAACRVLRVNPALRAEPQLLNSAPYDEGWIADLRLTQAKSVMPGLIGLVDAVEWIRSEIDRLVAVTGAAATSNATLADGGDLALGISDQLDPHAWQKVKAGLFERQ